MSSASNENKIYLLGPPEEKVTSMVNYNEYAHRHNDSQNLYMQGYPKINAKKRQTLHYDQSSTVDKED